MKWVEGTRWHIGPGKREDTHLEELFLSRDKSDVKVGFIRAGVLSLWL